MNTKSLRGTYGKRLHSRIQYGALYDLRLPDGNRCLHLNAISVTSDPGETSRGAGKRRHQNAIGNLYPEVLLG